MNAFIETYDPTIEDSYRRQADIDGKRCTIEVLDTAGQEEYIALIDQWIHGAECFLLVYSISSRASFDRIRDFHKGIQLLKESSWSGSYGLVPVMLVANKCDRVAEREVSKAEGKALAAELGYGFVESSAKNDINVERAFYDAVRRLRQIHSSSEGRNYRRTKRPKRLYQSQKSHYEGKDGKCVVL